MKLMIYPHPVLNHPLIITIPKLIPFQQAASFLQKPTDHRPQIYPHRISLTHRAYRPRHRRSRPRQATPTPLCLAVTVPPRIILSNNNNNNTRHHRINSTTTRVVAVAEEETTAIPTTDGQVRTTG